MESFVGGGSYAAACWAVWVTLEDGLWLSSDFPMPRRLKARTTSVHTYQIKARKTELQCVQLRNEWFFIFSGTVFCKSLLNLDRIKIASWLNSDLQLPACVELLEFALSFFHVAALGSITFDPWVGQSLACGQALSWVQHKQPANEILPKGRGIVITWIII